MESLVTSEVIHIQNCTSEISEVVADCNVYELSQDKEVNVCEPKQGTTFDSLHTMEYHLHEYGRSIGFQWRIRTSRKDKKEGEVCAIRYVCSKEGSNKYRGQQVNQPQPTTREGCVASVSATKQNGMWTINKAFLKHSHQTDPSLSPHLPRYRDLHPYMRHRLVMNDLAGINVGQTYAALAVQHRSPDPVCASKRDCRNYVKGVRDLFLSAGDAEAVQKYFQKMQSLNSNFFHIIDVDEDQHVRNIFWSDARSRAAYLEFGDVVSFDTTYLKNKYKMPFAPFVGVNHHGHSVLLGCALLSNENVQSFTWAFTAWLSSMGDLAPKSIITDQDPAIGRAIELVFPKSRHRWCIWHIMKKVEQKLGSRKNFGKIQYLLFKAVYQTYSPAEFDASWTNLIDRFSLHDNEWLSFLCKKRERWAPAYLNDCFWAGMQSTQRSEGMNSFFSHYVHSSTPLWLFVQQYDNALRDKVVKEAEADAYSKRVVQPAVTPFEIEEIFQKFYTLDKFKEFQEEARECIRCEVVELDPVGNNCIFHVLEKNGKPPKQHIFVVNLHSDTVDIECSCCVFITDGILCRHMISVLNKRNINTLPDKYILKRWRRDVTRCHTRVRVPYIDYDLDPELKKFNDLQIDFERVSTLAFIDEQAYSIMKSGLEALEKQLEEHRSVSMEKSLLRSHHSISSIATFRSTDHVSTRVRKKATISKQKDSGGVKLKNPKVIQSKGRPRNTRLQNDSQRKSKIHKKRKIQELDENGMELETATNRRQCKKKIDGALAVGKSNVVKKSGGGTAMKNDVIKCKRKTKRLTEIQCNEIDILPQPIKKATREGSHDNVSQGRGIKKKTHDASSLKKQKLLDNYFPVTKS